MLRYAYKAITDTGKKKRGIIHATGEEDFERVLAEKNLKCYWFHASGKKEGTKFSKLDNASVLAFCRQLSSMLNAGLPLLKSLEMLYERTEKAKLKNVYAALFENVQKGNSLAEAMGNLGNAFPVLLVSMVKSGEMSGKLEETLIKMAEYYEKEKKKKAQIKEATAYPKIVMVICLLVVIVLLAKVMPGVLQNVPPENIPKPTKVLLVIKDFLFNNWFIILAVILSLIILNPIIKKINAVDIYLSKMKLRRPLFGKLNKMIYTSRFASSLATLCSSGVNLLDALNMVTEMMENTYVSQQLEKSIEAIRRGESISAALQSVEAFDPLLKTMIFVGEESGSLDEILEQTAVYFEGESNNAIKRLTTLINPLLMLVIAVIIGFILIAIMLPMFAMYESIG